ncbi:MAG: endonuclease domain-containing protein [Nitrospirota bacterium]
MLSYNKNLKKFSKNLRINMTDAEHLIWSRIRRKQLKGLQFYRQKIIGNYIVDFYCPELKLVIEVDGGQHYSAEGKDRDHARDEYMNKIGMRVLRFSDRDVLKRIDVVIEKIWREL